MGDMPEVVVIGAGVIGLSTARCLQMATKARVTVVAENFSPHTTSDGAFGVWEPYCVELDDRVRRWGRETFTHMEGLAHSPEAAAAGAFSISGVTLYGAATEDVPWKDDVHGFRALSQAELSKYPSHSSGFAYTTMATECRYYLPWLMHKFLETGGQVISKKLASFHELRGYDVIVNCAGLGARELTRDPDLFPIRGHVLRVSAPWLRHFTMADESDLYIIPGIDGVVLGGSHEEGAWGREASLATRKRIWEGCCHLQPSLKAAKVQGEWVGLRPGRPSVRLEREVIRTAEGTSLQVVHNYGHGGAGITLHWGCALEATSQVMECLQGYPKIKRTSRL